jgi:hypothetical protein
VRAYVPLFLAIKANDVETRASHNIPARIRLSVFLGTLVHSTGVGLTKVDFPGNDDAERNGWDGLVGPSIPNLERYIEARPELFVWASAWTYKPKDGATDPR